MSTFFEKLILSCNFVFDEGCFTFVETRKGKEIFMPCQMKVVQPVLCKPTINLVPNSEPF